MKSTLAVLTASLALLAACESAPPSPPAAPEPVPAPAAAPSTQPITIAPATAATAGPAPQGEAVPATPVRSLRDAQQRLQQLGYEPGPADGANGPRTEQAMRAFQRAKGLRATGRMDSPTREALSAAR